MTIALEKGFMRRAIAALLATLLSSPLAHSGVVSAVGTIQGLVTVDGRPLRGVGLAFVDVRSGAIRRSVSTGGGAFSLQVAPGEYVVTAETGAGLVVGRGPATVPVRAGQTSSLSLDLLALPGAALPEPGQAGLTIEHTPVGCLVEGEFALIPATIEPAADVAKARVYFKSVLASGFYYVEMTSQEGKFVGKLPRPKIEASPIVYYIGASGLRPGEAQTPQYTATVVKSKAECPDALIGTAPASPVFSAATGAVVTPVGFAASGLALTSGLLALILGSAAAAGIAAIVNVINPPPTPSPSPRTSPTPTPEPTPIATPTPSPVPTAPPYCPHPPCS
jgi:hypothetical protein